MLFFGLFGGGRRNDGGVNTFIKNRILDSLNTLIRNVGEQGLLDELNSIRSRVNRLDSSFSKEALVRAVRIDEYLKDMLADVSKKRFRTAHLRAEFINHELDGLEFRAQGGISPIRTAEDKQAKKYENELKKTRETLRASKEQAAGVMIEIDGVSEELYSADELLRISVASCDDQIAEQQAKIDSLMGRGDFSGSAESDMNIAGMRIEALEAYQENFKKIKENNAAAQMMRIANQELTKAMRLGPSLEEMKNLLDEYRTIENGIPLSPVAGDASGGKLGSGNRTSGSPSFQPVAAPAGDHGNYGQESSRNVASIGASAVPNMDNLSKSDLRKMLMEARRSVSILENRLQAMKERNAASFQEKKAIFAKLQPLLQENMKMEHAAEGNPQLRVRQEELKAKIRTLKRDKIKVENDLAAQQQYIDNYSNKIGLFQDAERLLEARLENRTMEQFTGSSRFADVGALAQFIRQGVRESNEEAAILGDAVAISRSERYEVDERDPDLYYGTRKSDPNEFADLEREFGLKDET